MLRLHLYLNDSQKSIKGNLKIEADIEKTRTIRNGDIIQARLKEKDKKDLTMKEKSKLRKEQIFISHDRTKKERVT